MGSDSGGGEGLEARVAKLEAAVEHIQADMAEIRVRPPYAFKAQVHDDFKDLRADMRSDFRWTISVLAGGAVGLAGLMAKGFKWL